MAAYIRPIGSALGSFNNITEDFTANGAITNGDFVQFDGSGKVQAATTGRIIGTAQSTVATTATVKVLMSPFIKYLVQNDNVGTTFAATHVGTYFNLTGATGAQLVDTSTTSATLGQLLCLQFNPTIDPVRTDATWGVFAVAQSVFDGVTQN